jgi:diguanylate cyclase (GGDEF)-like protein
MIRLLHLPWPCWVATTDTGGVIEEVSAPLVPESAAGPLKLDDLLAPASQVLFHGVMIVELLTTGSCTDIVLWLRLAGRGDVPVVCNARLDPETGRIGWAFIEARRREAVERTLIEQQREAARRAMDSERDANTDRLTGLANRRRFLAFFENRAQSLKGALLLIDVDHFKRINDTLGHLAGDDVLRRVAQALASAIREGDLLARFGGEEFILWSPGCCSFEDALALGERLRRSVERAGLAPGGRDLTVSVGVCVVDALGTDRLSDIIGLADEALYAAKRAGRNCVKLAVSGHAESADSCSPGSAALCGGRVRGHAPA